MTLKNRKFHHSLLDSGSCLFRNWARKTRPGIRGPETSPEPQSPRGAAWESHQSAAQWREPQPGGPGTSQFQVFSEESLSHMQVLHCSVSPAHLGIGTKSPAWWREETEAKDPGCSFDLDQRVVLH
nr:uncharacterized protein LOC102922988 isoform X12 [Peromyscus maniculatus bairdii]